MDQIASVSSALQSSHAMSVPTHHSTRNLRIEVPTYHSTSIDMILDCKMPPFAYPLSNACWPRVVGLGGYIQDTPPPPEDIEMMVGNEGPSYLPGAPGTRAMVAAIVGQKRLAEEAPEGHESKRLVTDEMNRTSWGGDRKSVV